MKATELYKRLALFNLMSNKRALNASYRALILAPDHARGCGGFGVMKCNVDLGLEHEVCVNADGFLQVIRSLPDAEFIVSVNANNIIRWECGRAKGHLTPITQVPIDEPIQPDDVVREHNEPYLLSEKFGIGLELSSLACSNMSVRSLDLEGVQIRNAEDGVYAYSSDNKIMSSCRLGPSISALDGQVVTLKPEAADLLAAVVKREPNGVFNCDDRSFYCLTDAVELQINQIAPLRHNLAAELAPFAAHNYTVPLMSETIAAFLRRAEALADIHQPTEVEICVDGSRTSLRFHDVAGSSEEYYIVEGGPQITIPPMHLEASLLAKALAHADRIAFDHASQGILVLHGENQFIFVISGYPGGLPGIPALPAPQE